MQACLIGNVSSKGDAERKGDHKIEMRAPYECGNRRIREESGLECGHGVPDKPTQKG